MKRLLIAMVSAALLAPNLAISADRKMSAADSHALARALADAESPNGKARGYQFDGDASDSRYPHLEYFADYCCSSEGGRHFALDLYTGDGWDMTTCKEIKSRKLERLQREVRRRIRLTDRRYRQIKVTMQPCN